MTTDAPIDRETLLEMMRESGLVAEMQEQIREQIMNEMPLPQLQGGGSDGIDGLESGGGFPWTYWKKRDGRIITGPHPDYNETLLRTYYKKGYIALSKYGKLPTPGSQVPCCPGLSQKDNQFHVLLVNGGAEELSIDQVVGAGWHLQPPVVHGRRISFPQLLKVKTETIECDECDLPIHGYIDDKGRSTAVMGLRQHGQVAHKFNRRDIDDMLARIEARKPKEDANGNP